MVKGSSLFVGRLRELSDNKEGNFRKFESNDKMIYTPTKCEVCEEHEYYCYIVTDVEQSDIGDHELPVTEPVCCQCANQSPHPTSTEYHKNK